MRRQPQRRVVQEGRAVGKTMHARPGRYSTQSNISVLSISLCALCARCCRSRWRGVRWGTCPTRGSWGPEARRRLGAVGLVRLVVRRVRLVVVGVVVGVGVAAGGEATPLETPPPMRFILRRLPSTATPPTTRRRRGNSCKGCGCCHARLPRWACVSKHRPSSRTKRFFESFGRKVAPTPTPRPPRSKYGPTRHHPGRVSGRDAKALGLLYECCVATERLHERCIANAYHSEDF